MTKAEEIIYNKLKNSLNAIYKRPDIFSDYYIKEITKDCVNEIREEFRKAGVDVWKGGEE